MSPHTTATLTFIDADGVSRTIAAPVGGSLMHAATSHNIDGIAGACGGSCACATCHVMIDPAFHALLPLMTPAEDLMLNNVATSRSANSRLACQIPVTTALDGLVVHLPEYQI